MKRRKSIGKNANSRATSELLSEPQARPFLYNPQIHNLTAASYWCCTGYTGSIRPWNADGSPLECRRVSAKAPLLCRGKLRLTTTFALVRIFRVSDHRKTSFFERPADRYRRGTEGNGSIQILWRPQIAHSHTVALCGGAGEVIGTIP